MQDKFLKQPMTLIELIIVLGILAALASITLTVADKTAQESRFETTQKRGKALQQAIRNSEQNSFVRDMGRLPVVNSEAEPLKELYNAPGAVRYQAQTMKLSEAPIKFSNTTILNKGTVTLFCGWRGPYIDAAGKFTDGWKKPWLIKFSDGSWNKATGSDANKVIYGVKSLGADSKDGSGSSSENEKWYNADQEFHFPALPLETRLIIDIFYFDPQTKEHKGAAVKFSKLGCSFFTPFIKTDSAMLNRYDWGWTNNTSHYPNGDEIIKDNSSKNEFFASAVTLSDSKYKGKIPEARHHSSSSTIVINNLTPGLRKIFCYAIEGSTIIKSSIENVELKCGTNYIKVYVR